MTQIEQDNLTARRYREQAGPGLPTTEEEPLAARVVEPDNITPPPHYRDTEGPQIITSDTARQGPAGNRVLVVLVVSLVAAVLVVGILAMVFGYGH